MLKRLHIRSLHKLQHTKKHLCATVNDFNRRFVSCSDKNKESEKKKDGENKKDGEKKQDGDKKQNLSAVLKKKNELVLEERPLPKVGVGEVIIAIDSVGICGSDVHFWKDGRIGPIELKEPMVIGHEASGVIAHVGKCVKNLKKGDRVAIEPGVPCRMCSYCKEGNYNLCPKMRFCATPPVDGNLCQYFRHPADFCYKLPNSLTMEEGALLEPLTVGVAACRRAMVNLGMSLLILGSGPIGLATMMVAQSLSVDKIMITDVNKERLEVAKDLGATEILAVEKGQPIAKIAECIINRMGGMPDRTIDCCGAVETAQLAMHVTRTGGICCLVGMSGEVVPLSLIDGIAREVDIVGVFRYRNEYPTALSLAKSGKLALKTLVTNHFMLKDTQKAFETAHKQECGTLKVIIHVQERDKNNPEPFEDTEC